jgi:hypothetical protein
MCWPLRLCLLAGGLTALSVPTAGAQVLAKSLDQLRVLVKAGDTVSVTDATGRRVSGPITDVSKDTLILLVDGNPFALSERDIATVRQRRADSLANGAKWGFGVGLGLGLLVGVAIAAELDDSSSSSAAVIPVAGLAYGGIGAGVGVGIDAMIRRTRVIYSRDGTQTARVRIVPVLSRQGAGVEGSILF